MKKLLSLFLCLILLFGLLPLTAPARADSSGDWEYTVNGDYTTITKYTGSGGKVTIPSSLGGKPVKGIGGSAFQNCTSLTGVTIPKNITSIGGYAFSGCDGLTRVEISDLAAWCAIVFNGESANPLTYAHVLYLNGKALTKLTIPDGVTAVGSYAFSGCSALRSVTMPASVTSIGDWTFYGCKGLTSLTIPASVTSIGDSAFRGCTVLTSVTIPNSVTSIGSYAFLGCRGLTSLTIPDSVTSIGDYAFSYCSSLIDVTIPKSVKTVSESAFSGCTGLTSLTIPASVTSIGNQAFSGCTGLTSVTIPASVTEIGSSAFSGCTELTSLTIKSGVKSIGATAFAGCTGLTSVTIPASVTEIGFEAFSDCGGLTSLGPVGSGCDLQWNLPDIIPDNAFSDLSLYSLRVVVIPGTVTEIRQDAFSGCSKLQHVYFGGTEARWEDILILGGNDKLLSAELHCGYQTGDTIIVASGSCGERLTWTLDQKGKLTVSGSGAMSSYAFVDSSYCSRIRTAVLENGVTNIGSSAFSGCTNLTSITIPNSVTSIGGSAFSDCSSLTSVTIPGRITSIGYGAFSCCAGLTSVTIPGSVTRIVDSTFCGCTGLTSVTIPSSVTSIGTDAFHGCTDMTAVTIPKSVSTIESGAFSNCTGLTDVYYTGTAEDWTRVSISSGNAPLTSAVIHFIPPVITAVTADKTSAAAGEAVTWAVKAEGGYGTLQYAFRVYRNGAIAQKGTYAKSNTFTYTPTEAGIYKVLVYVKDTLGTIVSMMSSVSVNVGAPVITAQPTSQSVEPGTDVTFTVTTSGTGLSYQWQYSKDGGTTWTNKSGATGTSCSVTAKTSYDGFLYRCRVKNVGGTVYSDSAKLTVTSSKPVITAQPADQSVASGATATFKVAASGTGLTYQWQYSKDGGATWYSKSGATSASCSVTAKTSYNGFLYRCRVKNAGGTINSDPAKLSVTSAGPVISSVKTGVTSAYAGEKITWTAAASGGSGTLKYYFILYKDGVKVKTRSYSTTNTFSYTPAEAGSYKVKVYVKDSTGAKSYKTSGKIAVTLGPPAILSVKAGKTSSAVGEKITWTVAAVGSEQPLKYYFILYKDGAKLKTRSYSTTNTFSYTPTEAGSYKVKVYVKDATGAKIYKNSAKLTVTD